MSTVIQSKILIVEDETIVALDIKRRLEKLGYRVTGLAAKARQVFELIDAEQPDIILMDIHLNDTLDGIDVANLVNQKYRIPVIFVTAYSEDSTMGRASQTRPYGYLLKPFSERDLCAVIKISLERSKWDEKLQRREAHLKLAIDAANMGTWEITESAGSHIELANLPNQDLAHISSWEEFRLLIKASDRARVDREINGLHNRLKDTIEVEFEIVDPHAQPRIYMLYGIAGDNGVDRARDAVGVIQDITERKLIEKELRQAAQVFNTSSEAIVVTDQHLAVLNANASFYRMTGQTEDTTRGQPLTFLTEANIGEEVNRDMLAKLAQGENWRGEIRSYRKTGELFHALVNISPITQNKHSNWQFVILISDISEIRSAQAELAYIAYYDALTELPNRHLFMDRLNMAIARAGRTDKQLALLFIDLDHFKRVNDTLGHQVGDQMLRHVADRMRPALRHSDTLCRIGGDEFIVMVDTFNSDRDLEILARKIIDVVRQPMQLGNKMFTPGCSVGISIFPRDTTDKDDLVKMADTAMYSAKNQGRGCFSFYKPQMTQQVAHYLNREQELRQALHNKEFVLHYQLQFSADEKTIVGVEALIRWQHPESGLLSAAEVIPIAENSGLIVEIGEWVIEEACRQYRAWVDEGNPRLRIAVNVSVMQLRDPRFVSIVANALKTNNMPGEFLEMEVTESSLQNSENNVTALRFIESLGVTISIDDFGTGYSCMSSLKTLPIHRLKIDQSFVKDIPGDRNDCAIATAIIVLGHELGMKIIAEGIETQVQADFVRAAGCDELQGYLFGRPVAADVLVTQLRQQLFPTR
ncbi:GGDEF domain-containing response regulator [Gammaproteobacteria bacterium LSUCC0112]|nr:GGDEF domain-containing response regulator [Gammaproteobacteria bacterium LSUCC0112]